MHSVLQTSVVCFSSHWILQWLSSVIKEHQCFFCSFILPPKELHSMCGCSAMSLLKRRICLFLNCSFLLPLAPLILDKIKAILSGTAFFSCRSQKVDLSNTWTVYRPDYKKLNTYPESYMTEINILYLFPHQIQFWVKQKKKQASKQTKDSKIKVIDVLYFHYIFL